MSSANIDPAAILNRALEYAAQNLKVEKLLIQLGLDPSNISYDVVFNRLVDIVLANINFANMLALVGATLYVVTLMVRTIVPLRVIGIISMVFFIAYGALAGAVTTFLLYLLSLPINVIRLRQMLTLVKKARLSAQGDLVTARKISGGTRTPAGTTTKMANATLFGTWRARGHNAFAASLQLRLRTGHKPDQAHRIGVLQICIDRSDDHACFDGDQVNADE